MGSYLELVDSVDVRDGELSDQLSVARRQRLPDEGIDADEFKLKKREADLINPKRT
jgi:hypothetical protein